MLVKRRNEKGQYHLVEILEKLTRAQKYGTKKGKAP
jgi:hypothetical protein